MKKRLLLLLVPLLLLSGCGGRDEPSERETAAETYSFQDGMYAASEPSADRTPYLVIHDGFYTVVLDVAVSYQPGGRIQRDGDRITLEGRYGDSDYRCSFTLIANDELRFELEQSKIPKNQTAWTDGMVFTLAASYADRNDDSAGQNGMSSAQTELTELFPEYFGLDASKGLDVIVWQMAPSDYSFGLLKHSETQREWVSKELMDLKGVSAEQMQEILATYAVSEDAVYIVPWQNPISSYLPAYCVNYGGEDMDAKKEAYAAEIRGMLFG